MKRDTSDDTNRRHVWLLAVTSALVAAVIAYGTVWALSTSSDARKIGALPKEYRFDYKNHPFHKTNDSSIDPPSIFSLISPQGRRVSLFPHEPPPARRARRIKETTG